MFNDKIWVIDQSKRAQGSIYIINLRKQRDSGNLTLPLHSVSKTI